MVWLSDHYYPIAGKIFPKLRLSNLELVISSDDEGTFGLRRMTKFNTAEDIAEEILYLTGKAILEHDDDVFISCVALPLLMETVNGQRVFISEDEVRHCLLGVRQHMKECDLVDFARTVVSAKFLDANTIGSTHVSQMLHRDGRSVRSPFPVYSVIRRFEASWKMISCIYAILDSPEHNEALLSGDLLNESAM